LTEAFVNGEDIHAAVAAQIHGVPLADVTREQRSGAKMVNFGIVYGITAFGLARRLGCSNSEADEIITGYKQRFAGITTFLEECVAQAKQHGYVETMLKRRRPIPDIDSNQPNRRSLAERMAINSVVQGSAADLIKLAMIDLHRLIKSSPVADGDPAGNGGREADGGRPEALTDVLMLLQIHDELVFEAPEPTADAAAGLIVDRMQRAMDLRVPLVVDHGTSANWYEGK
ncbi:MAG: DNA polymerase, partial [Planctomycetota bacterium]